EGIFTFPALPFSSPALSLALSVPTALAGRPPLCVHPFSRSALRVHPFNDDENAVLGRRHTEEAVPLRGHLIQPLGCTLMVGKTGHLIFLHNLPFLYFSSFACLVPFCPFFPVFT